MRLEFKKDTHEYFADGTQIPCVSNILADVGIVDYSGVRHDVLEQAAERGRHIHYATALYDFGTLDESTVFDEWRGYFEAWKRFMSDFAPEWICIEWPIMSKRYMFATTPDRIGIVNGRLSDVEIKTTALIMTSTSIQTAAHCICYNEGKAIKDKIKDRYCVQLKDDGTYRLEQYKVKSDEAIFLQALSIYNWKRNNNKGGVK